MESTGYLFQMLVISALVCAINIDVIAGVFNARNAFDRHSLSFGRFRQHTGDKSSAACSETAQHEWRTSSVALNQIGAGSGGTLD